MKSKYRDIAKYIMKSKYRDEKNPYIDPADAWKEGFSAAERLYQWKRNCADTPIPKDRRVIVRDTLGAVFEIQFTKTYSCWITAYNSLWSGDIKNITHWLEIPEVENE